MGIFSRFFKENRSNVSINTNITEQFTSPCSMPFGSLFDLANQSDLSLSSVYRGVTLISNTVSTLPLTLSKRTSKGLKAFVTCPSYEIITSQPNHFTTMSELLKLLVQSALIHGAGYAYIKRDDVGNCVGLYFLKHGTVTPLTRTSIFNEPMYMINAEGLRITTEACNLIIIKNFSEDGLTTRSALDICRQVLTTSKASEKQASEFFSGGQVPKLGYLKTDREDLTEKQKTAMKSSWLQSNGCNGLALLDNGVTYEQISLNNADSELLSTRKWQVFEIARILGLSGSDLGESGGVTYSSLEVQNLAFYTKCIVHWVEQIENEFMKCFLPTARKNIVIKMDVSSILRADLNTSSQYYMRLVQIGAMTPNEVREKAGFEAIDGADIPMCQSNLISLSNAQRMTQTSNSTIPTEDPNKNNENNE